MRLPTVKLPFFPAGLGDLRVKVWPIVLFALTRLPFFILTTARALYTISHAPKGIISLLTPDEILVDHHDDGKIALLHT